MPYHLIIPTLFSLVGLLAILFNRKKFFDYKKLIWKSVLVFLIIYFYFVGTALFETIYYQWNLNQFDLNQDGMFSGIEITDNQKDAMNKLISDTGRNFSFITGFIFALLVSTIFYFFGLSILKFKKINSRIRG